MEKIIEFSTLYRSVHFITFLWWQVDDDKVVSGSYDKTLKVWDIKSGECRITLRWGRGYNKVRKVELNTQSGTVKVRMQKNTLPEGIYKISLSCFI